MRVIKVYVDILNNVAHSLENIGMLIICKEVTEYQIQMVYKVFKMNVMFRYILCNNTFIIIHTYTIIGQQEKTQDVVL